MTTMKQVPSTLEEIRASVQARYGAIAEKAAGGATAASCCGPSGGSSGCCGTTSESWDPITSDLYEAGQTEGIPAEALLASLGCGNPTALAELKPGETARLDCLTESVPAPGPEIDTVLAMAGN